MKAVAALTRKSPSDKVLQGQGIDQALTDHKNVFPNPNPPQATIQAATLELQLAVEEAATNSIVGRQRLKKAVKGYDGVIRTYQGYVNQEAQGDGVKIGLSGLQVSKTAQKAAPLTAPGNPRLGGTNAGELNATVEPQSGARAYVWMIYVGAAAPVADADWQYFTGTTQAHALLAPFPTGSRVWMRCAAIGTRGQGPWSEPMSRLVL